MKLLYTVFFSLCLSVGLWAQAKTTLVKSLAVEGYESLLIDLPGSVEVRLWDEPFARLTTSIELKDFDEPFLKRLIAAGRYEAKIEGKGSEPALLMPKVSIQINIKGKELKEAIHYELYLPKTCLYKVEEHSSM